MHELRGILRQQRTDLEKQKRGNSIRIITEELLRVRDDPKYDDYPTGMKQVKVNSLAVGLFECFPPGVDRIDLNGLVIPRTNGVSTQTKPWTLEDLNAFGARTDSKHWENIIDPKASP